MVCLDLFWLHAKLTSSNRQLSVFIESWIHHMIGIFTERRSQMKICTYPAYAWLCEHIIDQSVIYSLWPLSAAHLRTACDGAGVAIASVFAMELVVPSARGSAARSLRRLLSREQPPGRRWLSRVVGALVRFAATLRSRWGDYAAIHRVG